MAARIVLNSTHPTRNGNTTPGAEHATTLGPGRAEGAIRVPYRRVSTAMRGSSRPQGGRSAGTTATRVASGPIPKFGSSCGTLVYELRNLRTTSNSIFLVPLLNPKFAIAFAARCARTSGSGHWGGQGRRNSNRLVFLSGRPNDHDWAAFPPWPA